MESAANVLKYYEVKLLKRLPLESDIFLAELNKMNLLPRDTRSSIQAKRTREKKVSYFIHHVIKPGAHIFLPQLVFVMEQSDDLAVRKLAKKMSKKLNSGKSLVAPTGRKQRKDSDIDEFDDINLRHEEVTAAYSYLLSRVTILFEEVKFTTLKRICKCTGTLLPPEFKEQIAAAQQLEDILDVLEQPMYCNWLNIRLLKRIVTNSRIKKALKYIDIYEEHVGSRKVSNVKKYFTEGYFDKKTLSVVRVEFNKSDQELTVKDIIASNKKVEKVLDIFTGAASPKSVNPGCLKLTFVIPLYCTLHAYKMAKRNFLRLRQFHIQYLEIESFPKVFALNHHFDDENTRAILSSNNPKFSDPSQVISHYYTYLETHLDADSVSHMMHYKHLITDDDHEAITAAPNDIKINTILLQYIRAMDTNKFNRFCDILKNIEMQRIIGNVLLNSLEITPKMPINGKKQSMIVHDDDDLSNIHLHFFNLVDNLILLLSTAEKLPFDIVKVLHNLKACDSFPLFTGKLLQKFSNCKCISSFKIYLLPFITWLDHSILCELATASGNATAIELLDKFKHKIDKNKSVTSYPIPTPNQLMIPLDDSECTLLAVKPYNYRNDITLYQIEELKLLMTRCFKVTSHVFQLIAIHTKFGYLYWMVPKHLVPYIQENLKINYELSQNINTISILPNDSLSSKSVYSLQEELRGPFSLLYSQAHDDKNQLTNELVLRHDFRRSQVSNLQSRFEQLFMKLGDISDLKEATYKTFENIFQFATNTLENQTPIFVLEIFAQKSESELYHLLKSKTPYCNLFNFLDFIEQIANTINNKDARKTISENKEILYHMRKDEIMSYMNMEDSEKEGFSKVVLEMAKNFDFVTYGEIQHHKQLISFILKLKNLVGFVGYDEDHQTVTYLIPSTFIEQAYNNANNCADRFFTFDIFCITIGGNKIFHIQSELVLEKKQFLSVGNSSMKINQVLVKLLHAYVIT